MKCNRCGHEIAEGMHFCTQCGARLSQEEPRQTAGDKSEYRVVFERKNALYALFQAIVVKVDHAEVCRLKNGETKEVRVARGTHEVEFSIFCTKPKKITVDVNDDLYFRCYGSVAGGLTNPLLFTPIVVENKDGMSL